MFLILFNLVGFFGGAGLVFMHYRRSKGVKLTRISSEGNPNLKTELFKKYSQGRIVADVMFVVCLILTVFLERVLRYGRNYYVFFWVILVTSLILLGSMSYMIWIQLRRR
ncbi:hypothetical protein [Ligilactobacillus ceti]|nr:hypothetical protein [Ligilactobacillus ceti]